ncbi:glycosyltransferase family 2 protein [Thermodesulfobacteriota bacterium]
MKPPQPKITILMPVFNAEKHLLDAMDSILNQTFADFEFLIINDGSADRSCEIISSYADARIRLVHNDTNLGVEKTLNKGFTLAKGDYIARMDSDDISLPARLEKQVAFMQAHKHIAVCGTWIETFGATHRTHKYPGSHKDICCRLLFETALAHPSVMLRRNVLLQSSLLYDETHQYRRAEDYDLWVRISKIFDLANIGEVLLKYRQHESNVGQLHKTETETTADRIRQRQLEDFIPNISDDELALHSMISNRRFQVSREFLAAAERWLQRIREANPAQGGYDEAALQNLLAHYWSRIGYQASRLGLHAWRRFRQSDLYSQSALGIKKEMVFLLKCLLKKEFLYIGGTATR